MNAKQLIALAYEAHMRDHTATADFEVCANPLCQLAYAAETELDELREAAEFFYAYSDQSGDSDGRWQEYAMKRWNGVW